MTHKYEGRAREHYSWMKGCRMSRTERWFQTFIQAMILAACGFVVWAVTCRGI